MTEPKLTTEQDEELEFWWMNQSASYQILADLAARMVAEARAEGWQAGRQWDLLDQYSDTIRQIALSNVRLRRQVAEAEKTARAEALREAADVWQQGEWANAPRCADRAPERIANGQFVTDWLRKRAEGTP